MVIIASLADMFSQKSGAQSSMAIMVINAVISYLDAAWSGWNYVWWWKSRWKHNFSFVKLHC